MSGSFRGTRGNRSDAEDYATDATLVTGRKAAWRGPSKDRPVRPRRNVTQKPLPIIAIDGGEVYLERTGGRWLMDELPNLMLTEPSSIVVAQNVSIVIRNLDAIFDADPRWQLRASPVERELYGPDRTKRKIVQSDTIFSFFGWRPEYAPGSQKKTRTPSKYHYPIDPLLFLRRSVRDLTGSDRPSIDLLTEWAIDVRDFAMSQGLVIRPTSGGFAAQLLRDPRFYPEARRKVPKATNAKARELLPGNHYKLNCSTTRSHPATYLDQVSAHHTVASELAFPDADTLFARGRFRRENEHRPWCRPGSKLFERTIRQYGLLYAKVVIPFLPASAFPPPWMDKQPGEYFVYMYTNEVDDFLALGGSFVYLVAAWTSPDRDEGLNRYAKWSLSQLRESDPTRKAWLKPTLLSTYGILAAKPRKLETAFKRAKHGEPVNYPVAGGTIALIARKTSSPVEMRTANVIHRGMIEAETRARSLRLARDLAEHGLDVLAVYADSVFVRSDKPLPLLPEHWTVKNYLTRLRFLNEVSFISNEIAKLPGVPKESQYLVALRQHGRIAAERGRGSVRPTR